MITQPTPPHEQQIRTRNLLMGLILRAEIVLPDEQVNKINALVAQKTKIPEDIFGMDVLCIFSKKASFVRKWKVTKKFPWHIK